MKIVFVYASYENLGIEYLSAALKKEGYETSLVFDPRLFNDKFLSIGFLKKVYNLEHFITNKIIEENPDIIAFSLVSSDLQWAFRIAKEIKKKKDITIVFGGIHTSSTPEVVIKKDYIDFVIVGEGEQPLVELIDALKGKKDFSRIKNLVFKNKKKIITNPVRPIAENLDNLPLPDKELFYSKAPFLKKEYTIITRRGCLNACTYCHNSVWTNKFIKKGYKLVRLRSVDNVIEELREAYKKYKFKKIRINDDIFTSDKKWLKEFSEKYSKEFNVPIWCSVNPSTIDEGIVRMLKKINCFQAGMGVQSINPETRYKILNRHDTNDQIKNAIQLFKKYDIRCITDNLIGLPGQDEDELLDLAKFYTENPVNRVCVYWLIYFPNTKIVDIALSQGVIDKNVIQNIKEEPVESANTLINSYNNKKLIRYNLLLLFTFLLPKKLMRHIIKKKWYDKFPLINPTLIESPITFFMKDREEVERTRYVKRYLYYVLRIPLMKIFQRY